MIHRIAMQSERAESPEALPPSSVARKLMPVLLVWLPTVLGLAVSAMLLVDYVRPAPVFCEENGGCDVVKRTIFASVLGIPTPAYGLAAFTLLAVLALVRGKRPRLAHLAVASIAALVGLALLFVQFLMDVYCKYCLVVDLATLVVLVGAVSRTKTKWELPEGRRYPALLATLFALAAALPLGVGFLKPVPVPQVISDELKKTPPGTVTVVDFVDFECPFCRMTQAELAPIVAANRSRMRVVRKQVPLRMHPHAMDAARAACCAEHLGKGDEMADALFAAPLEELTPDGCEKLAASLGLDPGGFRDCVKDPQTDERIKSDVADFKASRGHGLPTIWIETQKLEGAQPSEVLESAVKTALSKKS